MCKIKRLAAVNVQCTTSSFVHHHHLSFYIKNNDMKSDWKQVQFYAFTLSYNIMLTFSSREPYLLHSFKMTLIVLGSFGIFFWGGVCIKLYLFCSFQRVLNAKVNIYYHKLSQLVILRIWLMLQYYAVEPPLNSHQLW